MGCSTLTNTTLSRKGMSSLCNLPLARPSLKFSVRRPQVSAGGYAGLVLVLSLVFISVKLISLLISHAFEALCTTPTPPASPIQVTQTTADINLHNLWGSVISRKLGDLRLLVCGEVDCVQGQKASCLRVDFWC